jgi:predicted peptidase
MSQLATLVFMSAIRHAAPALALVIIGAASAGSAEPVPGKQVAASTTVKVAGENGQEREVTLRHWLFVPADYSADESKRWPLVLFLHGSGERGDDLELVKKHGPPKLLDARPDFPAVVLSPQCPKDQRWNAAELAKLVEAAANNLRIDRQRLYVTGLSMGGSGTWSLLADYPGLFAAAVPICGRGDATKVSQIAKTPVWATVGAQDRAETVKSNLDLVAALTAGGGVAGLTLYPDLPHDCWTATYDDPAVWKWLLDQKRNTQKQGLVGESARNSSF